eukprot:754307-Hanusia_phi.AAC.1
MTVDEGQVRWETSKITLTAEGAGQGEGRMVPCSGSSGLYHEGEGETFTVHYIALDSLSPPLLNLRCLRTSLDPTPISFPFAVRVVNSKEQNFPVPSNAPQGGSVGGMSIAIAPVDNAQEDFEWIMRVRRRVNGTKEREEDGGKER